MKLSQFIIELEAQSSQLVIDPIISVEIGGYFVTPDGTFDYEGDEEGDTRTPMLVINMEDV